MNSHSSTCYNRSERNDLSDGASQLSIVHRRHSWKSWRFRYRRDCRARALRLLRPRVLRGCGESDGAVSPTVAIMGTLVSLLVAWFPTPTRYARRLNAGSRMAVPAPVLLERVQLRSVGVACAAWNEIAGSPAVVRAAVAFACYEVDPVMRLPVLCSSWAPHARRTSGSTHAPFPLCSVRC